MAKSSDMVGLTLDQLLGVDGGAQSPTARKAEGEKASRRHKRRSSEQHRYEELAKASWFLQNFRGFPLGAWRHIQEGARTTAHPLDPSTDVLCDGDVLLIDAFEEFPTLDETPKHFLVAALVPNSMAPRHSRFFDRARGVCALSGLLIVVALEDLGMWHIFKGTLLLVTFLISIQAVHADSLTSILSWPLLLSIAAGEDDSSMSTRSLSLIVIFSCNLVIKAPQLPDAALRQKPKFFSAREFLCWGVPVQALATVTVVGWTLIGSIEA